MVACGWKGEALEHMMFFFRLGMGLKSVADIEEEVAEINTRVQNATNGLIKESVPKQFIQKDTFLILANSLYFIDPLKDARFLSCLIMLAIKMSSTFPSTFFFDPDEKDGLHELMKQLSSDSALLSLHFKFNENAKDKDSKVQT
uniref:Serpin domain-containing protein n=1 Tax=Cannabis sativa TaxID=3483 RepID=A0A803PTJ6_CANSA